jgi:hypothetical protein
MAFAMQLSWMVIDTATGLGVTGLTAAGSFTTLKVREDTTLGADIKASATVVDDGAGNYYMAFTTEGTPVKEVKVIPVMATATYQAVPCIVGAESLRQLAGTAVVTDINAKIGAKGGIPALDASTGLVLTGYGPAAIPVAKAGDAMDLVDTLKHKAGAAGYDRTTDSMEAVGDKVQNLPASPAAVGSAMDLIDTLKHVAGSSGYDRTTDSMEAVGSAAASVKTTTDKIETMVEAVS